MLGIPEFGMYSVNCSVDAGKSSGTLPGGPGPEARQSRETGVGGGGKGRHPGAWAGRGVLGYFQDLPEAEHTAGV